MTWWLRSRRAPLLALLVLVEAVLVAAAGSARIPVPSLAAAGTVPIVAAVFLPLLVNSGVQYSLEGRDRWMELSAVRRVELLDAALVACVVLLVAALGWAAHAAGAEVALEGARNAVAYVGLGLVAAWIAGPRAGSTVPVAYVLLVAVFASGSTVETDAWSWPVHGARSSVAAAIALGLLATGAAALLSRPRGPR